MRKLRLIGMSALAVLAVSAVSASAANAAEGTATVSGEGAQAYTALQVGSHTFTLPGGRTLSCSTAEFKGSITNGAKTVTATPIYTGCSAAGPGGPFPVTVDTTDCTYKFTDLTTSGAEDTYNAATEVCASGGPIHIKVYSSAANHAAGTRLCEYTVANQNVAGVTFKDNTNGSIQIKATESAVNITRSFGTLANCGETNTVSKYNGDTNAKADTVGVTLGIHHT